MSHKPIVAFVLPVLAPYHVPRFRCLAEFGDFDVHVLLERREFPSRPGWIAKEILGCTVTVLRSLLTSKRRRDQDLQTNEVDKAYPWSLPLELVRLKPDIVLVCNPTQFVFAAAVRFIVRFRLGLIMEDTLVSESRKPQWVQFGRRVLYRRADFAFCYSRDAQDYLAAIANSLRLYRASWSIDPEWLEAKRCKNERRSVGNVSVVRFLFVGALVERKGVMPMLEGWKRFIETGGDGELVLVGDGPLRGDVEKFIADGYLSSVRLVGSLPYQSVRDHYLSSDVFILPTMQDLFSLVVTEAMAFGLPVITTIFNGACELVVPGENGLIIDPTSYDDIVRAFSEMSSQRLRLPEMGNRSRSIIAHYTHDKVMSRIQESLHAELANRG